MSRLRPGKARRAASKVRQCPSRPQKAGRAGGQAARPVFVFFARDAVPITPNAAPEAAEQTMLQLPFEKENGMEELAFAQQ